ncbi:hypothetical protein ACFPIJ_40790 [Dactylosporangium cerinum]|uniref:Uncharacterized protein n=1 Tax=Dactylosporangium cerinum TaxID=1434730 RepID=A0ABV9W9I8_9ACTN
MLPAIGVSSEEIGDVKGLSAMAWIGLTAASVAVFATVFVAPAAATWLVDRLKGHAPVVGSAQQSRIRACESRMISNGLRQGPLNRRFDPREGSGKSEPASFGLLQRPVIGYERAPSN